MIYDSNRTEKTIYFTVDDTAISSIQKEQLKKDIIRLLALAL